MMRPTRLPIRHRLTLIFAAGLALVVTGLEAFVYISAGADLLAAMDDGLRSQAQLLASNLRKHGPELVNVAPQLIENNEVFAQIADAPGRIRQSTSTISRTRLLPATTIRRLPAARFFERKIPGVDNITRILAVPVVTPGGRLVVIVGASLDDRKEQLDQLRVSLVTGGGAAIVLITGAAWLALGGALRPVERMRREAAAISASDTYRRLTPPHGGDEISALAATLNQMLDRIAESVDRERRLVDRASHELRTPLAIQRMDADLALSGPQTVPELNAALRSMSAENAHLTRLTEDLLVVARARSGVLPLRRADVWLPGVVAEACRRAGLRAGPVQVSFHAASERAHLDPVWFRQAIHNLVDNAVKHTPPGGRVEVSATRQGGTTVLVVTDGGPGFADTELGTVFEPLGQSATGASGHGTGLGLPVVRLIADAHGGSARAENLADRGARITITIPDHVPDGQGIMDP